jgi:hypothetical protein
VPSAIKERMEVYEDSTPGTNQFAVYPSDYPERYEKLYKSYIFLGRNRHWRSVGHTTGNIFITKPLFHKYRKIFDDFAVTFNEGTTINAIWAEVPAISPIPSLSAHLNDETMPSFIDWEKLL